MLGPVRRWEGRTSTHSLVLVFRRCSSRGVRRGGGFELFCFFLSSSCSSGSLAFSSFSRAALTSSSSFLCPSNSFSTFSFISFSSLNLLLCSTSICTLILFLQEALLDPAGTLKQLHRSWSCTRDRPSSASSFTFYFPFDCFLAAFTLRVLPPLHPFSSVFETDPCHLFGSVGPLAYHLLGLS